MRSKKIGIFKKEIYEKLIKIIGSLSYRLFEYTDPDTSNIFDFVKEDSKVLVVGTAPTDPNLQYLCEGQLVPAGKEVLIIKHLRKDFKNPKNPHYNTDIWALVPTTEEIILNMQVIDLFREHVIKPEELEEVIYSEYWPKNKSGTTQELYSECKAPEVKLKLKENSNN